MTGQRCDEGGVGQEKAKEYMGHKDKGPLSEKQFASKAGRVGKGQWEGSNMKKV